METNENIIEPQEEVVSPTDEGISNIVGSFDPVEGDPFEGEDEPVQPEEPIQPEEPVQPEVSSDEILTNLIRLALTGYELPDIIATYAVESGWDAETLNAAILTYGHDFGQFLMDEGLIDSEVEKKFLNYTMHYHIVDSLERLGKVDFDKEYEDFKDWILTWAETKNYQSVLDALSTIGGKEVVIASTVEDVVTASKDGSTALLVENIVFEPESTVSEVNASSIVLNNATIISTEEKKNTITFNAAEDITIKGMSIEGKYPLQNTNYLLINKTSKVGKKSSAVDETSGELTISGSSFSADAYNGISIGATGGYNYHTINIVDCDFSSVLTNNIINIYGCAEGGVINIKNCTFAGSYSNPIRFFNSSNVNATINIENCEFKHWETESDRFEGKNEEYGYDYRYAYAGMLLLEDHKSGSTEAEMENKKFAKVTVNINNCTGPFGKITKPKSLSDICGSMNKDQLIYVSYWNTVLYLADNLDSKGDRKKVYSIGYAGYEDHFPTINIA